MTDIYEGDPNIFAELGLRDAGTHLLKAQLVATIYRLVKARKLTQEKAGKLMGISQPEVSRLFKGHFREYSVERLMGIVVSFDRDVEIHVRPAAVAGRKGRITVRDEAA